MTQPAPMTALTVASSRAFPNEFEWKMIMQTAAHVWKSGMASDYGVKSESSIILIMLKGWELGLPLMGSLEHIRVIHGRVSVSAECQQALVLSRVSGARFRWVADGTNGVAELLAIRPGHSDVTVRYTMEDATRGGVAGKNPTYRSWPANLLRAGAMRNACRIQFPDVILGMSGSDDGPEEDASPEAAPLALAARESPSVPALSTVETKVAALPAPAAKPAALPAPAPKVVQSAPSVAASVEDPFDDEPPSRSVSREPGDDSDEAPPDYPLPFEDGRFAGKKLSDLADEREFRLMLNGFRNAAATAEREGNKERVTDRLGWADLVLNWAVFRGHNLQ